MKKKRRRLAKPKRGYGWLLAVWIGGIAAFIAVGMVMEGQFTYSEPDGILIKADERPFWFWAGVAFPVSVFAFMIALITSGELNYRCHLKAYQEQELENGE